VFDGHGGKEVSIFVKERFINELMKLSEFKSQDYEGALRELFKVMDDILLSEDGVESLKRI